jgi:uncharacterized RDD family membrane protein YckC/Tfp pilus assembly protein PilE
MEKVLAALCKNQTATTRSLQMFCAYCGKAVSTSDSFCVSCGKPTQMAGANQGSDHDVIRAEARVQPHVSENVYAGFWRRAGAWIIDYFVLAFAYGMLFAIVGVIIGTKPSGTMSLLVVVSFVLLPWLYYAICESSDQQATLGKRALDIQVTSLEGQTISFGRATGRFFGRIVSAITFSVGYAMAGFTQKRQALHDIMADTLVVRRGFSEHEIADAGPAQRTSPIVKVAIVVVLVLFGPFGIGILAAIAIPAYQDYTIRAQVAQGLIEVAPFKDHIAEALLRGDSVSTIDNEHMRLDSDISSKYVRTVEIRGGVIAITFSNQAQRNIAGGTLELVPGIDSERRLIWRCGYADGPPNSQFVVNDPGQRTSIPQKYLPVACRAPHG